MLLSLQIMAMPTWKEMPCVENLQTAYCVNRRNTNIPGYWCQQSVFWDSYRSMGHFLCSVERIKRFVNVHCIASSAMLPLSEQIIRTTRTVAQWNLIIAYLQRSKAMEKHAKKKLIEWNVYFFRILIRLYIYYIIHKMCISLKTPLVQH